MKAVVVFVIAFLGTSVNAADPALNVQEWSSAKEILVQARRLIVENGWQHGEVEKVNAECMATALEGSWKKLGKSLVEFEYARDAASRAIGMSRAPFRTAGDPLSVPYWGRNFMYWNDAPGRTENEVLKAFDKAIAIADVEQTKAIRLNKNISALTSFDNKGMKLLKLSK